MVAPGILALSIIRGIEFDALVLQLRDESVTVTGTLNPDVTGTYTPHGSFGAYPLFILEGSPSTLLYYNTTALSYVIARTLTQGGLTDFWVLAPQGTEPTGSYAPGGAYTGTATATDHPVDLTGFDVEAVARRTVNATDILLDLNPSITNFAGGEITIPAITSTVTNALEFVGAFNWDLVLTSGGNRFGPYVKGPFTVSDNITQI